VEDAAAPETNDFQSFDDAAVEQPAEAAATMDAFGEVQDTGMDAFNDAALAEPDELMYVP
jgi:hypothetical protein